MKRLSTIIMALALVLGMSQCKKQETPTNGDNGEKVYVTLNVSNGESLAVNVDNGGRHAVAPNLGVIQFREGDVLYVGNNGKYVGQLTYNNGAFGGTLYYATGGDFLHFYFLGNAELSEPLPETIEEGTEITSRTISIADQSTNLPVLCYGHSTETYGSATNYSATLEYKCALVRFKLNKTTDYKCTLSNMLTEATIDFANKAITPTATTGSIDLYREEGNTGVRWAILLPGTDLTSDDNDLNTTGYQGQADLANLQNNDYINSGITLTNPVFAAPGADYAVKTNAGVLTQFSVSSTQKVYFSRANLKHNESTHVWSFHTNQIDECPGSGTSTSGGSGSVSLDGGSEMDRFCWGYVGNTTVSSTDDWVDGSRNLNWNDGTDWGCALEGTAYGDHWRTLTAAEWQYLLSSRSGNRFLRVAWKQMGIPNWTIAGVTGIIIAPDDYTGGSSYSEWNQVNKIHTFGTDVASVNALLNDGCVFLPALGYRNNDKYYEYDYHRTSADGTYMKGYYWTATGVEFPHNSAETPQATAFRFDKTTFTYAYLPKRELGMCVRLVWDAN